MSGDPVTLLSLK